jgi:sec-independent protein translocase protein TatC
MSKHTPSADAQMPFFEHLAELRSRLIRALLSVLVSMVACFTWAEPLYGWLAQPLIDALPADDKALIFLNPVEPFLVYLKVATLAGILVSSPYCLYQLWKFIAPGLEPREKKAVTPFVLFGSVFFIGGALFCRYVVLPLGMQALMGFAFETTAFKIEPQVTMQDYFSVCTKMMLAFGAVFELPVIVLFLSWVGLLSHKTLIHYWRHAIVGSFIIGALLTPPDVITQLLLAGPLMLLYALSIGIAYIFGPRTSAATMAFPPSDEDEP